MTRSARPSSAERGAGQQLGMGDVVLEQRVHDVRDALVLGADGRAEVDALEHEPAQLAHRRARLLALDDVPGAGGVLDEVVHERVDP